MLWGLLGGALAVGIEVSYRKDWISWSLSWMWLILPSILLLNYSIWRLVTGEQTYIGAIVWFGFVTAIARIAASISLFHEPMDFRMVAGAGALLFARLVWLF